jgi:hypothetical protein
MYRYIHIKKSKLIPCLLYLRCFLDGLRCYNRRGCGLLSSRLLLLSGGRPVAARRQTLFAEYSGGGRRCRLLRLVLLLLVLFRVRAQLEEGGREELGVAVVAAGG